ncbi:MAG: hypothetical protein JSS40_13160 [Proteobacteria bacterium]|nr:hypothetical protein [Pseudomonadota bacterium]
MDDNDLRSGPSFHYRREGGVTLIEIQLAKVEQLFNSLDPSPFHQQDLDKDAEEYIVDSVLDLAPDAPVRLVIHLPPGALAEPRVKTMQDSIRHFFSYGHASTLRKRRLHMREGRLALALGLAFLFSCIMLRQVFFKDPGTLLGEAFSEGLLILGWVAIWRPMEMLLYDWWPITRRANTYRRLSAIEVEVRPVSRP